MGMQFTKIELEAGKHPQCPQLPSIEGNYFINGYEAAATKYINEIKQLKVQVKKMPRLTKREWYLVKCACRCLYDSLDISNSELKDRQPEIYKINEKDMKTLDKIITKISGEIEIDE